MEAVFEWLFGSAGVLLLLVLLFGVYLILRRRIISRNGGTFELALRRANSPAEHGWRLGMGRYHHGALEWFPVFSPDPRPKRSWARNTLTIQGQRDPQGQELAALFSGNVIVTCNSAEGEIELAMGSSSLTGFASWLEAGPPGSRRQ